MKTRREHRRILAALSGSPEGMLKTSLAAALLSREDCHLKRPLTELFQRGFVEVLSGGAPSTWLTGNASSQLPQRWDCCYRLTSSGRRAAETCGNN